MRDGEERSERRDGEAEALGLPRRQVRVECEQPRRQRRARRRAAAVAVVAAVVAAAAGAGGGRGVERGAGGSVGPLEKHADQPAALEAQRHRRRRPEAAGDRERPRRGALLELAREECVAQRGRGAEQRAEQTDALVRRRAPRALRRRRRRRQRRPREERTQRRARLSRLAALHRLARRRRRARRPAAVGGVGGGGAVGIEPDTRRPKVGAEHAHEFLERCTAGEPRDEAARHRRLIAIVLGRRRRRRLLGGRHLPQEAEQRGARAVDLRELAAQPLDGLALREGCGGRRRLVAAVGGGLRVDVHGPVARRRQRAHRGVEPGAVEGGMPFRQRTPEASRR